MSDRNQSPYWETKAKRAVERGNEAREVGRRAEDCAARFLGNLGMRLLQRNFRTGTGEIDLVLQDGETIVFCEVKARKSDRFGRCEEFVDYRKRRKLLRAARAYLAKERRARFYRFDVVEVYYELGCVRHIENVEMEGV